MNVVSIVGARPQFIKAAPLTADLWEALRGVDCAVLVTRQEYEEAISLAEEVIRWAQAIVERGTGVGSGGGSAVRA